VSAETGYVAYVETLGTVQAVWIRPVGGLQPQPGETPDCYVQDEEGWNFRLVESRRDLEQFLWDH
jgi:hypothetical protein